MFIVPLGIIALAGADNFGKRYLRLITMTNASYNSQGMSITTDYLTGDVISTSLFKSSGFYGGIVKSNSQDPSIASTGSVRSPNPTTRSLEIASVHNINASQKHSYCGYVDTSGNIGGFYSFMTRGNTHFANDLSVQTTGNTGDYMSGVFNHPTDNNIIVTGRIGWSGNTGNYRYGQITRLNSSGGIVWARSLQTNATDTVNHNAFRPYYDSYRDSVVFNTAHNVLWEAGYAAAANNNHYASSNAVWSGLIADNAGNRYIFGRNTSNNNTIVMRLNQSSIIPRATSTTGIVWRNEYSGNTNTPSEMGFDKDGNLVVLTVSGSSGRVLRLMASDGAIISADNISLSTGNFRGPSIQFTDILESYTVGGVFNQQNHFVARLPIKTGSISTTLGGFTITRTSTSSSRTSSSVSFDTTPSFSQSTANVWSPATYTPTATSPTSFSYSHVII